MTSVRSRPAPPDTAPVPGPVPRHGRWPRWAGPALVGAALGAGTVYTAVVDPNTSSAFPQCITKQFTGLDCPMCGGLRAVHALATGDLPAAVDHNAVVVVLLPMLAVLWATTLLRALGHEPPTVRVPTWAPWVAVVVLVVFTVVRNTALPGVAWLDSTA